MNILTPSQSYQIGGHDIQLETSDEVFQPD